MPTLQRDGFDLHYETHGSGPAILLTHGYSSSTLMWHPQIEALSQDHTLILWDMRGHGQSSSPTEDDAYSERLTTADMAALLDHLGFEQAIIGGLSLGGYMSLAFHVDYPERTRALLIIDTGPGFKNDDARAGWNEHARSMANDIARLGEKAFAGAPDHQPGAHRDLAGVVRAGHHMLTQSSARVIQSLPDIHVPSLIVVGENDEPFLAAAGYMAKKIPDAESVTLANAGHVANMDQPEAFNAAVLNFLQGLAQP